MIERVVDHQRRHRAEPIHWYGKNAWYVGENTAPWLTGDPPRYTE